MSEKHNAVETAVFAGGCFWCTEAVFSMLKGVKSVVPGYTGGTELSGSRPPTYEDVCEGGTGHAEAIRIDFDPAAISYVDLLTVFFNSHDPTTLNRQGNDVGTQYRSAIFYANEDQRHTADTFIRELTAEKAYDKPIVTELAPLRKFYEAESYHREYYKNNPSQAYCALVIAPKVEKVQKRFAELLANQ